MADTAQSAAPFKRHVDMTADEIREKYRYDQNWPIQSFDAKDWAKAFIDTLGARISYQLDEATMLGWFANALMRGWDERQWRLDAEAARLNQPAAPEQESGDEREALIEIGAKALYDETPLEEGGEAIDGFQVSPNTTVTWAQIVEHDGYAEIASDFRRMARTVLTAVWQAARAAAPASPLTEVEIECAIGGAYEMEDGRQFWIDAPVAREMARRVMEATRNKR